MAQDCRGDRYVANIRAKEISFWMLEQVDFESFDFKENSDE
jgi:hypothetical protein